MRRSRLYAGLALLLGIGLAFWASPVRGQEKMIEPPIVTVTSRDAQGHEHEEKFDLSKPDQLAAVKKLLDEDRVVHIAKEEPVSILALSADLGVWTVVVFLLLFLILRKAAWKPMLDGLKRREQNIYGA